MRKLRLIILIGSPIWYGSVMSWNYIRASGRFMEGVILGVNHWMIHILLMLIKGNLLLRRISMHLICHLLLILIMVILLLLILSTNWDRCLDVSVFLSIDMRVKILSMIEMKIGKWFIMNTRMNWSIYRVYYWPLFTLNRIFPL